MARILIAVSLFGALQLLGSATAADKLLHLKCAGRSENAAQLISFTVDLAKRQVELFGTATWDLLAEQPDRLVFGRPKNASFGSLWTLNRITGDLEQELKHSGGVSLYLYRCERAVPRI